MNKKYTTESFIQAAKQVHGDNCDYSNVVYSGVKNKVYLHCNIHDVDFEQSPEMHLKGYGCPKCAVEKRKKTMQDRMGVDFAMQSSDVVAKSNKKKFDKFGSVKVPGSGKKRMTKDEFVERAYAVHGFEYDYSRVVMNGSQNKVEIVCPRHGSYWQTPAKHLSGHGCPHKECIQAHREATTFNRYGYKNAMQSPDVQAQYANNYFDAHGVRNPMQLDEVKETLRQHNQEVYGVDCTFQLEEVKRKSYEKKKETGSYGKSVPEDDLYDLLCARFGKNDIERQYSSDVYPWHCDFYIKSLNLYIEANFYFSHGGHFFNKYSVDDQKKLKYWRERLSEGHPTYATAEDTWTRSDVEKREIARKNNLNYVVFWNKDFSDVDVWFELGCPVGHDWKCEYSWFDERVFDNVVSCPKKFTGTHSNLSMFAKHYQASVFYSHEIDMWNNNVIFRGVPVQLYLYKNRFKYIGKLPNDLTDFEILRGFTVAGIHKGYTVFNTELMDAVVEKYAISSVYDPCAGWGERMLYCKYHDMPYLGVDINDKLAPGYGKMQYDFGMKDQKFVIGDSSIATLSGTYDAVITCSPYYDIEQYSSYGAENLRYDKFLSWWENVVGNSKNLGVKYFCFQINRRYRDDMLNVVKNCGFEFVDELFFKSNKSSHFTRNKNGMDLKTEKESMLVCKRV